MGDAELDGDTVGVPGPDADGSVALAGHVPAVVRGFAVLDRCVAGVSDHDAVAAVVRQVGGVARVVVGGAVADAQMRGKRIMSHGDSGGTVFMGIHVRDSGIAGAVEPQSAAPEPTHVDAVDFRTLRIDNEDTVLGIPRLAPRADKDKVLHDEMVTAVCAETAAVACVDDRPSLAVRGDCEFPCGGPAVALAELDDAGKALAPLEADTVAGRAYVRDMVEHVKSLDPTRPVGFASYHLLVGRPWGDATRHSDFVMMNQYFGTWHGPKDSLGVALDTIHLTWPDKMVIVSEFGFYPHWQRVEGPGVIDPEQYYYIPEDAAADSPEADIQRQRVIVDQMAVYRSRPFVAAATFWCYRGVMGVVDPQGNPRPSWHTLQEEFAPLVIETVDFTIPKGSQPQVKIVLRTRGPIEVDLGNNFLAGSFD